MTDSAHAIHGIVAPGFERVRTAFHENFEQRGELGAAFAATLDGQVVVDLWGGLSDAESRRPWQDDTLVTIFSGTKALVALCLLMLADRGELDLDAPVAAYWPEFAASGKAAVTVAEIASHRALMPGLRTAVSAEDLIDDARLAALLAGQRQDDDPRASDVYHPLTYGWLCGEVIRRVDGRSVGRFFADEIAGPLELDIWIGLPPDLTDRVATIRFAGDWGRQPIYDSDVVARDGLVRAVWNNPPILRGDTLPWNRSDWRSAEIPGVGSIADARSLARLYGCLALGGELDGVRLLSPSMLRRARTELARRVDPLLGIPQAFGVGFQLQTELAVMGPPPDAFGHGGAGGSIHCAWPSEGVGLSYSMNLMRDDEDIDARAATLLTALHSAVQTAT
jgi:CubicO group peptidase (beta-lactamase class C family)